MRRSVEDRFWSWVDIREPYDCWPWKGGGRDGYGTFRVRVGLTESAHRCAWTFTHGAIPNGLQVLHRCDNPPCCNPQHLFLGTNLDNIRDAATKGRRVYVSGERHGQAKLTVEAVRQIRSSTEPNKPLADRYGVCMATIRRARSGALWKGVTQ